MVFSYLIEMSSNNRSRMMPEQKYELVQSVRMHLLRTTGRFVDVGDIKIEKDAWKNIAESLNLYGSPKTADQWKTSFYRMKRRVKQRVHQMLKKSADSGYPINISELSETDQIIAKMFYFEELTNKKILDEMEQLLSSDSHQYQEQENTDENPQPSVSLLDDNEYRVLKIKPTSPSVRRGPNIRVSRGGQNLQVSRGGEHVGGSRGGRHIIAGRGAHNIRVSRGGQNLQVSRGGEHVGGSRGGRHIIAGRGAHNIRVSRGGQNFQVSRGGYVRGSRGGRHILAGRGATKIRACRGGQKFQVSRGGYVHGSRGGRHILVSRGGRYFRVSRGLQTGIFTRVIRKLNNKLPRQKMTEAQKVRLLDLIEANFIRTVGRFSGANGVQIQRRIWLEYAKELNTMGPKRTGREWGKVFTTMKLRTKHKMVLLRKSRNVTGGGQSCVENLTEMDEKILSMIGVDNLDGHQNLGEGGFPYEILPFRNSSTNHKDDTPENMNYEIPQDPCALSCSVSNMSQDLEVSESQSQIQNPSSSSSDRNARGHSSHDANDSSQERTENVLVSSGRMAHSLPIRMSSDQNARGHSSRDANNRSQEGTNQNRRQYQLPRTSQIAGRNRIRITHRNVSFAYLIVQDLLMTTLGTIYELESSRVYPLSFYPCVFRSTHNEI